MSAQNASARFPALAVARRTGAETLHRGGRSLEASLLDFWRWSASDLMSNATRGVLAEWIVARALGLAPAVRVEWDAFDLLMLDGTGIEVKSGAYLQVWAQSKLSPIRFDVRPTRLEYQGGEAQRRAQIYVFCLLKHREQQSVDPLDLEQWEFYLVPTATLNCELGAQKTVALSVVRRLASPVEFDGVAAGVRALVSNSGAN